MNSIREHVAVPEKANKAIKSIRSGVIDQNAWEAINEALTYHDSTAQEANDKVYDAFRKAGYDAILDVHDMDSKTFGAKRPVIVFNGSIKTVVDSVSELSTSEMNFNMLVDVGKSTAESVIKQCPPFLAATGIVIAGGKSVATSRDNKIVRDYRKAHPNTELSYKEIVRNERRKQYT